MRLAGNDTGALAGVGGIAVPGAAALGLGQLIFRGGVGAAGVVVVTPQFWAFLLIAGWFVFPHEQMLWLFPSRLPVLGFWLMLRPPEPAVGHAPLLFCM